MSIMKSGLKEVAAIGAAVASMLSGTTVQQSSAVASAQVITLDKESKEITKPAPQAEKKKGNGPHRFSHRHTKPSIPHNQRQRRKQVRQNPHLRKKWGMK